MVREKSGQQPKNSNAALTRQVHKNIHGYLFINIHITI